MSERGQLVVIGAGGFSMEVMEAATLAGWQSFALYDDDAAKHGQSILGSRCLGPIAEFERSAPARFVLAIGNNALRQRLGERLEAAGHQPTSVFHPTTVISPTARIGSGTFLGPFVWVGPQVQLGRHALINAGVSIGHDAVLGSWVQLCPGTRISGFCSVGDGAFLGSNSVLGPRVVMEEWSQLAAASFAWRTIPARRLAVGSPAKIAPAS
jgi:acetyltransferase EpsM